MKFKWVLSSSSPVKRQALQTMLHRSYKFEEEEMSYLKCNSRVPEQPWGRYSTMLGAWNRQTELYAKTYKQLQCEGIILVSIENGLYPGTDGTLSNVSFMIMERVYPSYKLLTKEVLCFTIPEKIIKEYHKECNYENHKLEIFKDNSFPLFLKSKEPSMNIEEWPRRFHPKGYNRLECLTDGLLDMRTKLN